MTFCHRRTKTFLVVVIRLCISKSRASAMFSRWPSIEVRFQPPPDAPATQFQHLDPVSHANEAELGAISEPINAAFSSATSAYDELPETGKRDPDDPKTWGRIGRNEPCPCGSGKKFKHCHGGVTLH